jgi:hypothetical protein
VAALRNSIGNARLQFVAARNAYDQIAGELNRLGFNIQTVQSGFSGFSGLGAEFGSMGVLPAVVIDAMVLGGILMTAAVALSLAAGGISDAIRGNDGIITQTRKLIEAAGVTVSGTISSISTMAIVAGLGFAAWIGYKFLVKKGKV